MSSTDLPTTIRQAAALLDRRRRPTVVYDGFGDREVMWPPLPPEEVQRAARIALGLHPYREPA